MCLVQGADAGRQRRCARYGLREVQEKGGRPSVFNGNHYTPDSDNVPASCRLCIGCGTHVAESSPEITNWQQGNPTIGGRVGCAFYIKGQAAIKVGSTL
jgi:hypothetical protein